MREQMTARDYTRIDLLRIPLVRGLASPIIGDTIRALVALIFLLTLVAGLIGVQDSVRNLIVRSHRCCSGTFGHQLIRCGRSLPTARNSPNSPL
jgi:hypothetical protein